jgi:hypothetical protein
MASYAGLDMSQQETHLCVLDDSGRVLLRGQAPTDPAVIAELLAKSAPGLARVVMESGGPRLPPAPPARHGSLQDRIDGAAVDGYGHELHAREVPIVCIEARAAHRALQQMPVQDRCRRCRGLGPAIAQDVGTDIRKVEEG